MRADVELALRQQDHGTRIPFAVLHLQRGEHIGSTSFLHLEPNHRSVEIGSTWLGAEFHGSGINRECKALLLDVAFNELKVNRVMLQTDELNVRSRRAIEKLGSRIEGVHREHRIAWNGRVRSSAVYSILRREWVPQSDTPPAA